MTEQAIGIPSGPMRPSWLRRSWKGIVVTSVVFLVGLGIGAAAAGTNTRTRTVAGPTTVRKLTIIRRVVQPVIRYTTASEPTTPPPAPDPAGAGTGIIAYARL